METKTNRKPRVLLVEDDPEDAMIIRDLCCGRDGMRMPLEVADSLTTALSTSKLSSFDVVLLDLGLPESSGLETFQKARDALPDKPIVVLTGLDDPDVAQQCMAGGAQEFIDKATLGPFMGRVILNTVKRAELEKSIRATSRSMDDLIRNLGDGILVLSTSGRIRYANPQARELLGNHGVDPVGSHFGLPAMVGETNEIELERGSKDIRTVEMRVTETVWQGEPTRLVSLSDITDRKRAEQALRAEQARTQQYLDVAGVMMVAINADGIVTMINRKGCEILGYPSEHIVGRSWFEHFLPPESKQSAMEISATLLEESQNMFEYHESTILTRDGAERLITWHNAPLRSEKGRVIGHLSSGLDITEHRGLEAQLRQAQKLKSIGNLAGGVAHDFNNLLMGISGYVDLCREDIKQEKPITQWLDEVSRAVESSSNLTRQLLAFARRQPIAPITLDLNTVIESMLKLLRRLIGEDIQLVWVPQPDLWPIKLDPGQIDQILANLCVNARDAIGGVGTVTIETANRHLAEADRAIHPDIISGECVQLTVSDTGCGIEPDLLDHVFEPFFSTKGVGKGTGLGLATVYGIVSQNHGHISVESEVGEGTTFRICLPRDSAGEVKEAQTASQQICPRGSETILLVEDNRAVRVTTSRLLKGLGYHVLPADTPEKALQIASQHDGKIALLLTDVVMPGMSGRDLADEFEKRYPETLCLFMSGYTADIIANRGILDEDVHLLTKPFTRIDISHKIRELLDASPSTS